MIILPLVIFSQASKDLMLNIPAPQGIYKPDFTTCPEKDRDLYRAIFVGYLSITKKEFSVSILRGSWKRVGDNLELTLTQFMDQPYSALQSKIGGKGMFGGFVMKPQPNGDLTMQPIKGLVMKSELTFRREPAMKLVDALKAMSDLFETDLTKESEFTLPSKVYEQVFDQKSSLKSALLDIAESDEPMTVRTQAAMQLVDLRGDDLVRRVGNLLLETKPTKERAERIFRSSLIRALASSHHPASMYYALAAKQKGLISDGTVRTVLGNCENPEAVPILYQMAKAAKPSELPSILISMRRLSPKDGLKLANQVETGASAELQDEILKTRAVCGENETIRNRSVRALISKYYRMDWFQQADIVKVLGEAQTDLAFRFLKRVAKEGKGKDTDYILVGALERYGAKGASVDYP